MKHLTLIFILIQLLICCENPKEIQINEYLNKITSINELLEGNQINKQIFKLSNKDKRIIIAKNGLKIDFNADQLTTEDGTPLDDLINVEVVECINYTDFIKSNIRTTSNGRLLISGGAYNITMFSNGKLLKLKEGDSLTVYLPRFSEDEMSLFYGQKDSINQITWQNVNRALSVEEIPTLMAEVIVDSISRVDEIFLDTISRFNNPVENKIMEMVDTIARFNYYDPIKIKILDWLNCDRFFDQNQVTNLDYTIETSQDTLVVKVLLIFKDINSLTSSYFIKSRKSIYYEGFQNIPLEANVRIVAVGIINNQIYGFSKDIKIQENLNIEIDLYPMTEEELNLKRNWK